MAFISAFPETSLVLDNDVLTHWRNQQPYAVAAISAYQTRLKRPPALTSMTYFEVIFGIDNGVARHGLSAERAERYRNNMDALSRGCGVLPFDRTAAEIAAYVCANSDELYKKHWKDVLIAATALAHGHGVATGNKKHFELIGNTLSSNHPPLPLAIWKP
ncbi:MAG: type II toxin-antitoxin system VapC family toxin [Pyrinomonadaceae bacterium]